MLFPVQGYILLSSSMSRLRHYQKARQHWVPIAQLPKAGVYSQEGG